MGHPVSQSEYLLSANASAKCIGETFANVHKACFLARQGVYLKDKLIKLSNAVHDMSQCSQQISSTAPTRNASMVKDVRHINWTGHAVPLLL